MSQCVLTPAARIAKHQRVMFPLTRRRPTGTLIAASLLFLLTSGTALIFGCGAQHREGLPPAPVAERCPSITELAPILGQAIDTTSPERLRSIIERYGLMKKGVDGAPSPMQSVFWMLLRTIDDMGSDVPEAGALEGERCNDLEPPPPTDSNRICEARRLLSLYIHEAAALQSLDLLSSVMAGILEEIEGDPPDKPPRTRVLGIIGDGCRRRDVCSALDLFDLIIGILGFIEPTAEEPNRPRILLDKLRRPIAHPSTTAGLALLQAAMTIDGWVAFVNLIIDNIMILPTTGEAFAARYHEGIEIPINAILTSSGVTRTSERYGDLREAIDDLIGSHEDAAEPHGNARPVIYDLLDPAGPWKILEPLQGFIHCWRNVDATSEIVRFILEIDPGEGLGSLAQWIEVLDALIEVDDRIALMTFTRLTLQMLRDDAEGTDGFQRICAAFLDETPDPLTGKSSIDLILPGVTSFFATDTLRELVCLLDAFLYGCAGGAMPACQKTSEVIETASALDELP